MATFFFRAVASDGKLRTGSLTGETDKVVARELRRQGLTPIYVGIDQKNPFELKLREMEALSQEDSQVVAHGTAGSLLQRKYVVPFVLACVILAMLTWPK